MKALTKNPIPDILIAIAQLHAARTVPSLAPSLVLCAAAVSLLLGRIGRWSGRETDRSALSLARSAQAERDNESWFSCVQPAFIDL
ncbi:hypothetical protein EVAR_97127_1 [Eumeta japonica]|uniref:Uncharacterized protein n=1 Tax=Eumeta variegata TaxID=151549 RepID=A0A4C1WQ61_EUMVA|nr:hypothetical protein EVAR_97127_1 [Eumeta japonica]